MRAGGISLDLGHGPVVSGNGPIRPFVASKVDTETLFRFVCCATRAAGGLGGATYTINMCGPKHKLRSKGKEVRRGRSRCCAS